MIGLLIWIILVVIIAAAVLGVVRAALALAGPTIQPYATLVYALVVLLVILVVVSLFYGGPVGGDWARPPRL